MKRAAFFGVFSGILAIEVLSVPVFAALTPTGMGEWGGTSWNSGVSCNTGAYY